MRIPGVIPTLVTTIFCVAALSAGLSTSSRPSRSVLKPGSTSSTRPPQIKVKTGDTDARIISKIAFASDRDGNLEVYVMDVDGGGQTRLTENPGEDYSPAWSPDGSRLAFVSTRDGNAEIYV